MDGGGVAHGELVVSGGDGSVLCELVDAAFHRVALLAGVAVEDRWTPAAATFAAAVERQRFAALLARQVQLAVQPPRDRPNP